MDVVAGRLGEAGGVVSRLFTFGALANEDRSSETHLMTHPTSLTKPQEELLRTSK